MSRRYYTLCTIESDGKWHPQFGDYDRETVLDEQAEYINAGWKRTYETHVIATGDSQEAINKRIAEMNSPRRRRPS